MADGHIGASTELVAVQSFNALSDVLAKKKHMKNLFFLVMAILVIKFAFPVLGEAIVELFMLVVTTLTTIIGGANTAAAGL